MHCAACQSRVQSALTRTSGVRDATVNLMMNNATITYDENAVAPQQLIDAIKSTGYDAAMPAPDASAFAEQERQDEERRREVRELGTKTAVSLAIAVVAMALPMLAMAATWMAWLLLVL